MNAFSLYFCWFEQVSVSELQIHTIQRYSYRVSCVSLYIFFISIKRIIIKAGHQVIQENDFFSNTWTIYLQSTLLKCKWFLLFFYLECLRARFDLLLVLYFIIFYHILFTLNCLACWMITHNASYVKTKKYRKIYCYMTESLIKISNKPFDLLLKSLLDQFLQLSCISNMWDLYIKSFFQHAPKASTWTKVSAHFYTLYLWRNVSHCHLQACALWLCYQDLCRLFFFFTKICIALQQLLIVLL